MSEQYPYYYDQQIKKYIVQFMNIFAGMQVSTGKSTTNPEATKLISATIAYGSRDRVVGGILAGNTTNKLLRLPTMSVFINSLDLSPELRKGIGTERKSTYLPQGGVFPSDIKVVHQLMPIPYMLGVELMIYTSSTDQQLQLLEQIMLLFDPTLQIQKSDGVFDWDRLTHVELEGITFNENYPMAVDKRIITSSLQFKMPVMISAPANLKQDAIKKIMLRIGVSSAATNDDIITDLDEQGIQYDTLFDVQDIDIDQEAQP